MKKIAMFLLLLACSLPLMGFNGAREQKRAQLYLKSGETMQGQGNLDAALSFFDKAVRTDPGLAAAYRSRGFLYLQLGCRDVALQDFGKVIELAPLEPAGYVTRALAYSEADKAKAVADFKKGCELGDAPACQFFKQMAPAEPASPAL
ncbi:MAG TPA: hypothetical protein DCZ75_18105 [Geobacter sp.]|nr:hypothetical protein [Geobacter sp.]